MQDIQLKKRWQFNRTFRYIFNKPSFQQPPQPIMHTNVELHNIHIIIHVSKDNIYSINL